MSKSDDMVKSIGLGAKFLRLGPDDRVDYLLTAVVNSNIRVCPGCGELRNMVYHHWYESFNKRYPNKPIVKYKYICDKCNGSLNRNSGLKCPPVPDWVQKDSRYAEVACHWLPSWPVQKRFLAGKKLRRDMESDRR